MLDTLTILSGFIALSIVAVICLLDVWATHRAMENTTKHLIGGRDDA